MYIELIQNNKTFTKINLETYYRLSIIDRLIIDIHISLFSIWMTVSISVVDPHKFGLGSLKCESQRIIRLNQFYTFYFTFPYILYMYSDGGGIKIHRVTISGRLTIVVTNKYDYLHHVQFCVDF